MIGSPSCKDWESASSVAKAFAIGPREAGAVSNLQSKVSSYVVRQLREAIQLRGMRPFVTHEAIAKSVFNRGYTSGVGELEAWRHQLSNLDDDRLDTGII